MLQPQQRPSPSPNLEGQDFEPAMLKAVLALKHTVAARDAFVVRIVQHQRRLTDAAFHNGLRAEDIAKAPNDAKIKKKGNGYLCKFPRHRGQSGFESRTQDCLYEGFFCVFSTKGSHGQPRAVFYWTKTEYVVGPSYRGDFFWTDAC